MAQYKYKTVDRGFYVGISIRTRTQAKCKDCTALAKKVDYVDLCCYIDISGFKVIILWAFIGVKCIV